MDALFGGCSIAGALIASGEYKFEPLTPSLENVSNSTYTISPRDAFLFLIVLQAPGSGGGIATHWLSIGSSLSGSVTTRAVTGGGFGATYATTIDALDTRTIRCSVSNQGYMPAPPLGYIYEV